MSMMFHSQQTQETQEERRYDPETLRKVTALATRLQNEHQETLTASQMESIGLEVGLQPEFIQQAIAQLEEEHQRAQDHEARQQQEQETRKTHREQQETYRQLGTTTQTQLTATKTEFYSVCAAIAAPFLMGFMAWHFKSTMWQGGMMTGFPHLVPAPRPGMVMGFTLIAPAPMALLQGFLVGKRRLAFAASAAMLLALAPTAAFLGATTIEAYREALKTGLDMLPAMIGYTMAGLPVFGSLAIAGAWARKTYFPFREERQTETKEASVRVQDAPIHSAPAPATVNSSFQTQQQQSAQEHEISRREMLHKLSDMQAYPQLQTQPQFVNSRMAPPVAQKQRRTYLSVDVASVADLRQSATLVAVDYSFQQFRTWAEEIVRANGGQLESANGSSLVASFSAEGQSVRAARALQERVSQFNQTLNRLPMPFRLRCALSATDIGVAAQALERNANLLRSGEPGDTLISGEVSAAALAELGQLTPIPSASLADTSYLWRSA